MARWIDNHCHVDEADAPTVIAEARQAGVERMIVVGTDRTRSAAAIAVATANDGVWATIGLHPHDAESGVDGVAELLDQAATSAAVVAVGECGLDYHYDHSPRERQREVFAAQVGLAHTHGLPLMIHTRDAWDDTFDILATEGAPDPTVFHCFTGGAVEAERALAIGAHLSFSGIVSFKNADDVREAAALCPLERLLVETDAPYLAPTPHRGKPNRPAWVPHVGAAVAAVKGLDVEDIASSTWDVAARVYRLDD